MPGVYNIQVPVQPAAPISGMPAALAVPSKAPEICFPRPYLPRLPELSLCCSSRRGWRKGPLQSGRTSLSMVRNNPIRQLSHSRSPRTIGGSVESASQL